MRLQRAQRDGPQARVGVVIGQRHPVIHRAFGQGLHRRRHLGFALQAVRPELGNRLRCLAQHMAVRWQDEVDLVRVAGIGELVQRVEVGVHLAIGRVDDGRAAVQYVVARKQQAVFHQHQAHMVGRMAGRENNLQSVALRLMGKREQLLIR